MQNPALTKSIPIPSPIYSSSRSKSFEHPLPVLLLPEGFAVPNNKVNFHRGQLAALHRWKDATDPALRVARIALQEETFVAAIERALKSAPPITPTLRARVVALLPAGGAGVGQ